MLLAIPSGEPTTPYRYDSVTFLFSRMLCSCCNQQLTDTPKGFRTFSNKKKEWNVSTRYVLRPPRYSTLVRACYSVYNPVNIFWMEGGKNTTFFHSAWKSPAQLLGNLDKELAHLQIYKQRVIALGQQDK